MPQESPVSHQAPSLPTEQQSSEIAGCRANGVRWPFYTLAIAFAAPFAFGFVFFLFSANMGWSDGIGVIATGVEIGSGISVLAGLATLIGFFRHIVTRNWSIRFLILAFAIPPLLAVVLYLGMFAYAFIIHPINARNVLLYLTCAAVAPFLIFMGLAWRCRTVKRP